MNRYTAILNVAAAAALLCGCVGNQNASQYPISHPYDRVCISDETTVAHTIYGDVQGYKDGDIFTFKGITYAKAKNLPVMLDFTGYGCVNCREMEARVWSDPKVHEIMQNDYVMVALYTDDKTKLPESEWITTDSGKTLKDVGRVNSYIVRTRFNVNAQPNYALLSEDGDLLVPVRGYNLDVDAFVAFLNSGLKAAGK